MGELFERSVPDSPLPWTGERLTTGISGQVEIEHIHRYAFARDLCRGLDVLDIASGEGYGSALIAQVARSVTGVEIDEASVVHAQAAYKQLNLRFVQGDARAIPIEDASVDVVVSFETIEHFFEHEAFIREVRRVLRSGGRVIISSPERDTYSPAHGTPNPYHVRELTRSEFVGLLHSVFPHVSVFAQRSFLGGAIVAEERGSNPLLTFERRSEVRFEASSGLPRPLYWIAVASASPQIDIPDTLYLETPDVETIDARFRQAGHDVASLREQLEAHRSSAESRSEELRQANSTAEDIHRQLVQAIETSKESKRELLERSGRIVDLEKLLNDARALVVEKERDLKQLQGELEVVRGKLASLSFALTQATQRAAEVEHRLSEFYRSASWRLTGPLRGLATRNPGLIGLLKRAASKHPGAVRRMARILRGLLTENHTRPVPVEPTEPVLMPSSTPVSASSPSPSTSAAPTESSRRWTQIPAASAPRVWFFLGDTFDWLSEHDHLTGVGRVTTELFFASSRSGQAVAIPCICAQNPVGLARIDLNESLAFLSSRLGEQSSADDAATSKCAPPTPFVEAPAAGDHVLFTGVIWTPHYIELFNQLARSGVRISIVVYDVIPLEYPEYVSAIHRETFESWLRAALGLVDTIFVSSIGVRAQILRWTVLTGTPLSTRIVPIPFGVDSSAGTSSRHGAATPSKASRGISDRFVLSVGTIDQRKNQAMLCRLWVRLENMLPAGDVPQLVLIGRDDIGLDSLSEDVGALIKQRKIMVLQGVGDAELADLYAACLLTVFPSLSEGYGLPVAESLAHGKLCVSSDLAVIHEHAGDLPWYVTPDDETAWLEVLRRAISDESARVEAESRIASGYKARYWADTWRRMRGAASVPARPVRPASNLRQRPDIPNVAAADPGAAFRLSQRWCTDTSPCISILIVNWNATRITLECIRQIWANTEGVRYEIIIADNGSDPDSLLPLRDLGHGIRLLELGTNRYFGEANNIAAEAAQGQLLWLLNNDAFARPGCLRGLAASLDKEERAGAAGPLFLFPNGTVQEAGGAIDPDGFPVRALRGEAIGSRELSSHVVDYISAAALLVRKKYYFEVGGFDLAYEPAYYEDVDLCFKLRAIGHPVLFCPAAQVVHIEGTSANDDAAAAGRRKAMGDINRGKFVGRWSKFLESRSEDTLSEIVAKIQPGSPHAPKSPSSGAPTAVLYTPYQLTPGGGERFFLTIAAALSEDHRTTLVTPYPYSQLRLANLGRQLSIDLSRCRVATEAEFLAGPAPDCMVVLGNHVVPHIAARSRNCVFVCQFPFPADPEWLLAARERAGSYRLVLVYSEYARAHYLAEQNKYQTPAWPVEVLHPPVPQHGGDPSRKRRMILTVGRFFVGGHHKRHDLMIEAFRKLVQRAGQEVEFHIAGSSMPDPQNMEYLASLLRQAGDLPITFHVNVSSDQLGSLYRDAALYWHATGLDAPLATSPHEAEHFGITILEAMSAGCAPLVFNEGGPSEIVTQGVDGFLYGSLDELVDRTIELLAPEAEDYRVKIGIAAAGRAIAFSQSVFHERARSLLLDIPHPPGPVGSDKILASAGSPFLHFNSVFDADEIVRRYAMRDVHPRPGYLTNYLGVSVDPKFFPQLLDGRGGQVEGLPIPGNWHADMAEFAAVLRAVDLAQDNFTIIELGCGWGCWMNNAGAAAREMGLHVHLIGVEGDEGHIEFAKEACETNGFRPQEVTLYHGVAAARTGTALFPRQGQAGASWGLQPIFGATDEQESEALRSGTHDRLPMVAMADIAAPYQRIDLLHVDVQGGEVDLISGCLPVLQDKVAYLFVGSHSRQIEGRLFEVLLAAGWRLEIERPGFLKLDGACPYMWVDGAQGWRNPKLLPSDDR